MVCDFNKKDFYIKVCIQDSSSEQVLVLDLYLNLLVGHYMKNTNYM